MGLDLLIRFPVLELPAGISPACGIRSLLQQLCKHRSAVRPVQLVLVPVAEHLPWKVSFRLLIPAYLQQSKQILPWVAAVHSDAEPLRGLFSRLLRVVTSVPDRWKRGVLRQNKRPNPSVFAGICVELHRKSWYGVRFAGNASVPFAVFW